MPSPEWFTLACSLLGSVIVTAMGWGAMKEKIEELEKSRDLIHANFITKEVFNTIVGQLKETIADMRVDLKELLRRTER